MFTACDHVRRQPGACKHGWYGDLRTGKRRLHERLPPAAFAKLRIVAALTSHRAQVQLITLIEELSLSGGPYFETLQPATDPRPVFDVNRPEIVVAAPKEIEAAGQPAPFRGRKSNATGRTIQDQAPQLSGFRIQHCLVWQAHQKPAGHRIPQRSTSPHDTASAQLQEPRQRATRYMRMRGIRNGPARCFGSSRAGKISLF